MLIEERARVQVQLQRILESKTFRAADVLRRLLGFLVGKAIAEEADQLKEYTIGLDAFGKPPSYDPRHDAIVRLQVGRIRQKLGEYYRTEGKDDPVVFELPKGGFKIVWESRFTTPELSPAVDPLVAGAAHSEPRLAHSRWRWSTLALTAALLISAGWAVYSTVELSRAREYEASLAAWTPDLDQLWRPFITTKRRLIIAIADPLFVRIPGRNLLLRSMSANQWEDAGREPDIATLRRAFANPEIQPNFNYVGRGEVISSFLLERLLGTRQRDVSLSVTSQVTWQDLSENNVLLIGARRALDEKLVGMPLQVELQQEPDGIRNLHPRPGEPAIFEDTRTLDLNTGEVFALVSHVPGPLGNTSIDTFISNRTWGRLGAVQALTDPTLARTLVEQLKGPSGQMPRYYQILLKVQFRDGVSTSISYVLHRNLAQVEHASAGAK